MYYYSSSIEKIKGAITLVNVDGVKTPFKAYVKITGYDNVVKSGFTKELYAEYISPKTTDERKAEIFEKCVKSKTFVFKKDGSVKIEYASKIGDIVPNDGEFRIKATDLRTILEKSRDKLTRGSSHSEIVALRPRIQGLVAKVDSLDECPDDFLQFAKEYNLPIILMGNTNL